MKNLKRNNLPNPVWCAQCYLRIAPYERTAVRKGKTYHQVCYTKITKSR
jgi:hypothetical protein